MHLNQALNGRPHRRPWLLALSLALACAASHAQSPLASSLPAESLPDAPSHLLAPPPDEPSSSSQAPQQDVDKPTPKPGPVDAAGKPIALENYQPHRILGFMPNFRSVSGGSKPPPPGWRYNFKIATLQSFDYSAIIFVGLNSVSAEGLDEHPKLGKGVHGLYEYSWRGFLDKTDGTFLGGFLLPSLLHEDTRFYALGHGHSIPVRAAYVVSRQAVARTYSGRSIPNAAGLGGKVLTQYISRFYYPSGSSDFGTLAEKFGYSVMRDVIFSSIREFYPDIAAHYIRRHREKIARQAALATPTP